MSKKDVYSDITISGGGIVGCLSALALAKHTDYTITVIETKAITPLKHNEQAPTHAGFDARVIALAAESIEHLKYLGVELQNIQTQAIDSIHVSDKGHVGQVLLNKISQADNESCKSLGEVIALADLGQYLLSELTKHSQINLLAETNIQHVVRTQDSVCLNLDGANIINNKDHTLLTKLLLVCDGGNATFAKQLGINFKRTSYEQTAIITNVIMQKPHNNQAFERFTSQGPIAFLPMALSSGPKATANKLTQSKSNKVMSVVWCASNTKADDLLSLSHAEFSRQLEDLFGSRLGKIQDLSSRFVYPLALNQAEPYTTHRVASLGNAAQSLHPIAGQGFNLGIRDVVDMVKVQLESRTKNDPGSFHCMQQYKQLRDTDKRDTILATDSLVRVFSNQYWPLVLTRNLGLHVLNSFAPLKSAFTQFAIGRR
ncbi:FAD-dependent monooxygenase [Glaciecola petra]|uniref:FAD-dependent monooxygenase n=1 Tax=Glaciecola petra TaxID=3075602 RepID=A0ABU2ZLN0_9ALTE|nr:FAD-dependent monooxygenase [Aestuariibacter sp. P117]MDT0593534.1 FAD-dependent monooxygenase [Aestuariibacter sp. P117]